MDEDPDELAAAFFARQSEKERAKTILPIDDWTRVIIEIVDGRRRKISPSARNDDHYDDDHDDDDNDDDDHDGKKKRTHGHIAGAMDAVTLGREVVNSGVDAMDTSSSTTTTSTTWHLVTTMPPAPTQHHRVAAGGYEYGEGGVVGIVMNTNDARLLPYPARHRRADGDHGICGGVSQNITMGEIEEARRIIKDRLVRRLLEEEEEIFLEGEGEGEMTLEIDNHHRRSGWKLDDIGVRREDATKNNRWRGRHEYTATNYVHVCHSRHRHRILGAVPAKGKNVAKRGVPSPMDRYFSSVITPHGARGGGGGGDDSRSSSENEKN
ncbi:hypothetical protein ACHAXA_001846 [Cyclostephanos tholiformis]|uniref:Uncharacterized protein n=1 Tax=Cyclostephanos tholiformis TaxID=382380 RepID=A0ABD3RGI0_9STRA